MGEASSIEHNGFQRARSEAIQSGKSLSGSDHVVNTIAKMSAAKAGTLTPKAPEPKLSGDKSAEDKI
jgi:hypothetical protein